MRRPKGPAKWGELWIVRVLGGVRWVMRRDPWRGLSLPVPTPLCAYCGCEECVLAAERVDELKRPEPKVNASNGEGAPLETPKHLSKMPHVADLLLSPAWEGGEAKGETCLFVFCGGPFVKLLVKVENPPLKMMVQGRTWDEAWAALELVLKGEDVPWEQDSPRESGGRKKKK